MIRIQERTNSRQKLVSELGSRSKMGATSMTAFELPQQWCNFYAAKYLKPRAKFQSLTETADGKISCGCQGLKCWTKVC